jgi:hypothetical protein
MPFNPNESLPDPLQYPLVPGAPIPDAWARWFRAIDRIRGAYTSSSDVANAIVGKHTIWVPAGAMTARTTSGAVAAKSESSSYKINFNGLDFSASATQYAQFNVPFPKSWDAGTVTAKFYWRHPTTTVNFGVVWGLQGVCIANAEALDAAFGTAQTVADTGGTTDYLYISDETPAITVAGTPSAGELCYFQCYRKYDDAADTMAVVARLLGVRLLYNTSAANDT